jgi:hypothetical protein
VSALFVTLVLWVLGPIPPCLVPVPFHCDPRPRVMAGTMTGLSPSAGSVEKDGIADG